MSTFLVDELFSMCPRQHSLYMPTPFSTSQGQSQTLRLSSLSPPPGSPSRQTSITAHAKSDWSWSRFVQEHSLFILTVPSALASDPLSIGDRSSLTTAQNAQISASTIRRITAALLLTGRTFIRSELPYSRTPQRWPLWPATRFAHKRQRELSSCAN